MFILSAAVAAVVATTLRNWSSNYNYYSLEQWSSECGL